MFNLKALTLLAVGVGLVLAQSFTAHNNCSVPIDVRVTVEHGQVRTFTVPIGGLAELPSGNNNSFVYTYANADGYEGGSWPFGLRVGFSTGPGLWHYYLLRDPNPNNLNVGISIVPDKPVRNGFCQIATCATGLCTNAYITEAPFYLGDRPTDPNGQGQRAPNYQCPDANFKISFCPTGNFPLLPGTQVTFHGNSKKCLDVKDGILAEGSPVQIFDCNQSKGQKWFVKQGATGVQVAGTTLCIDAGSNPGDGTKLKLTKCDVRNKGQTWYYTGDSLEERRLIHGETDKGAFCLDLTKGSQANGNLLQTWQCGGAKNPNQLWGTVNTITV